MFPQSQESSNPSDSSGTSAISSKNMLNKKIFPPNFNYILNVSSYGGNIFYMKAHSLQRHSRFKRLQNGACSGAFLVERPCTYVRRWCSFSPWKRILSIALRMSKLGDHWMRKVKVAQSLFGSVRYFHTRDKQHKIEPNARKLLICISHLAKNGSL